MSGYSTMLYERIKSFLETDNWHYSFRDEGVFEMDFKMDSVISPIRIIIFVEKDCFQVRALLPISAEISNSKGLFELLKFVTKVNYQLKVGNFIVDIDDGEIAYKVHVDCEGIDAIGNEIVKNSVVCTILMSKRYIPGLVAILFYGENAYTAFEKCELEEKRRRMEILTSSENGMPVSE